MQILPRIGAALQHQIPSIKNSPTLRVVNSIHSLAQRQVSTPLNQRGIRNLLGSPTVLFLGITAVLCIAFAAFKLYGMMKRNTERQEYYAQLSSTPSTLRCVQDFDTPETAAFHQDKGYSNPVLEEMGVSPVTYLSVDSLDGIGLNENDDEGAEICIWSPTPCPDIPGEMVMRPVTFHCSEKTLATDLIRRINGQLVANARDPERRTLQQRRCVNLNDSHSTEIIPGMRYMLTSVKRNSISDPSFVETVLDKLKDKKIICDYGLARNGYFVQV